VIDAGFIVVPAYEVNVSAHSADGEIHFRSRILSASRLIRFDRTSAEVSFGEVRADVVGYRDTRCLLIEIFVTHKVDSVKQRKLVDLGIPTIEIDLSDLYLLGVSLQLDAVRARVVDEIEHKKWISHPGARSAKDELRAELDAEIVTINTRALRIEEDRQHRITAAASARIAARAAFRILPTSEKERRLRHSLRINGSWPEHINQERFDTGILALPCHLWQALLFEHFVERRRGGLEGFSVEELEQWAQEWVGLTEEEGRAPGPVLRGYAAFLAARGFLQRCLSRERQGPTWYRAPPPISPPKPSQLLMHRQPNKQRVSHAPTDQLEPALKWVWCENWPRRSTWSEEAIAELAGNDHSTALLAAINELSPLSYPETPYDFAKQLSCTGVPVESTMSLLEHLRLAVLLPPTRNRRT